MEGWLVRAMIMPSADRQETRRWATYEVRCRYIHIFTERREGDVCFYFAFFYYYSFFGIARNHQPFPRSLD